MMRKLLLILSVFLNTCLISEAQVRIRLLTGKNPQYYFFTVSTGRYVINNYVTGPLNINTGETFVISLYHNKVAVKTRDSRGFAADSVLISPEGQESRFTVKTDKEGRAAGVYSGALQCLPDMGSLLLINICDMEDYVAGVVKAEGGNGKRSEYFKTQAIIARTYSYRHLNRHILDRYNLCDGTHCQVYSGLTSDTIISRAALETKDLVIVSDDSIPIISAFHSNCGGETSPSEYVWPASQSYLVAVKDPWCLKSRNATWEKIIPLKTWTDMLIRNGYTGSTDSSSLFRFRQDSRKQDYTVGAFSFPFYRIREELGLRSAWFSVIPARDSLRLSGKGYGHGVGLCQEGAIAMAASGLKYQDIIDFYYKGVKIIPVSLTKKNQADILPENH